MLKIAIIDDEPTFSKLIKYITEKYFWEKAVDYRINVYESAQRLLDDIQEDHYYDIYLLDIEMPEISGMEIALEIRHKYEEAYILFITSHLEYSLKGYEYNAWRYITKNRIYEMLPMAFDGLIDKVQAKDERTYIIELYSKIYRFAYNDIYYLHKAGKYTKFCTKRGEFRERKPINRVLEGLHDNAFIITDRSFAVNLRHVLTLEKRILVMRNGDEVPVSISQLSSVRQAISDFWRV